MTTPEVFGTRGVATGLLRTAVGYSNREGHEMGNLVEGKTVLITGAGGDLGRASALQFAREGAQVLLCDLNKSAVGETYDLLRSEGAKAETFIGDVTSTEHCRRMVEKALAAFGSLDCAFNNAGINGNHVGAAGKRMLDWSEEAFEKVIAINLRGVWNCMRAQIAQMLRQKSGAIVNMGSVGGLVGRPRSSAYVASKHAVIGLTKTAALDYAEDGIRVNALCPGIALTRMSAERVRISPETTLSQIPMRRLGDPVEIAALAVWLCSDHASYVTGSTFNVDGGFLAA
jgi:NAD(P)-dependent dehydrogenase (short-subunit alcohol dehydrogenase family)